MDPGLYTSLQMQEIAKTNVERANNVVKADH